MVGVDADGDAAAAGDDAAADDAGRVAAAVAFATAAADNCSVAWSNAAWRQRDKNKGEENDNDVVFLSGLSNPNR